MSSKFSHQGYLQIDHRDSPGLTDTFLNENQVPLPPGSGLGHFESAILTCSHCQTMLIINPLRVRGREYCSKCDRYICDGCHVVLSQTGICKTFTQLVEEHIENEIRKTFISEI